MLGPLVVAVVAVVAIVFQYYYVYQAMIHFPLVGQKTYTTLACVNSAKGGQMVGSQRNCRENDGPHCTLSAPCKPCGYNGDSTDCQVCTGAAQGCDFRPNIGPYCLYDGETLPCLHCCHPPSFIPS